MKAFLLAMVAIVIVTVGSNVVLTRVVGSSTAAQTASDSVRLPDS